MKNFDKFLTLVRKINSPFSRSWIYPLSNRVVFLSVGIMCLFIGLLYRQLPPAIPLWFSKPWGQDRLASPIWLFILPGAGMVIHGINVFIGVILLKNHITFTNILLVGSIFTSLISLIITVNILYLVI